MKAKEESETVGLKLNIQKTKIMTSSPITSQLTDGEKVETLVDFISLGSKSLWTVTAATKLKALAPWKKNYDKPRQCIKKQRYHFAEKFCIVKNMVFPVVMYGCENWTVKQGECQRLYALELLEKTLVSSLGSKEIKPVNPKGNQPEYSLEGPVLKLKLHYFGHQMQKADSLEKTLMLGKTEGRRSE